MTAGLAFQATTNLRSLPINPWAGVSVLAAWAGMSPRSYRRAGVAAAGRVRVTTEHVPGKSYDWAVESSESTVSVVCQS